MVCYWFGIQLWSGKGYQSGCGLVEIGYHTMVRYRLVTSPWCCGNQDWLWFGSGW